MKMNRYQITALDPTNDHMYKCVISCEDEFNAVDSYKRMFKNRTIISCVPMAVNPVNQ